MSRLVKHIANNRQITFDKGRFDNWCVYVEETNGSKFAPLDVNYFSELLEISKKYPGWKIYNDFVIIYDQTDKTINNETLQNIDSLVNTYNSEDRIRIEQWFTVLYAGMIAEENKENAILKKRIKRLGMYQVLVQNVSPEIAAGFSKGKSWKELDILMKSYGF